MPTKLQDVHRIITEEKLVAQKSNFELDFGYSSRECNIYYSHSFQKEQGTSLTITISPKISKSDYLFKSFNYNSGGEFAEVEPDEKMKKSLRQQIERSQGRHQRNLKLKAEYQGEAEEPATSSGGPEVSTKTADDIAKLLSGEAAKRCLFFTGAGISTSSIPDWKGLMQLIGFDTEKDDKKNLDFLLENFKDLGYFQNATKELHKFHLAFIDGKPAPEHKALHQIVTKTGAMIVTDNKDLIHGNAGTNAPHVMSISSFFSKGKEFTLDPKEVDHVFVCAMSGDRRGFLKWLKTENPSIKITQIDRALSKTMAPDHFIEGDTGKILPKISSKIQAEKTPDTKVKADSSAKGLSKTRICNIL